MGFIPGYFFGIIFLILSLALTSIEVSRIFVGSLNRLANGTYNLYPGNLYFPSNFDSLNTFNRERQHQYLWPWSHPALLFSIPVICDFTKIFAFCLNIKCTKLIKVFLASLFGFSAARRGTYSMVSTFK